jgi:hypothetical protein
MRLAFGTYILAVVAGCLTITPLLGSVFESERESRPLLDLREWVVRTGNVTVIRGNVATEFGLGALDIPVYQRAFRPVGARLTEVMAVTAQKIGQDKAIFIARIDETDGSCVVWKTAAEGRLADTVTSEFFFSHLSPSERNFDFSAAKTYFLERYRLENSDR